MLINRFILPLVLTILLEGAIAFVIGFRDRQSMLTVAAVNGITNPTINLVAIFLLNFGFDKLFYWLILPLELLLIPIEWKLLSYAMPGKQANLLRLSACMNPVSYILGLLIL